MELSNLIYKVTRKHNIPADVYTAILMQESGYNESSINKTCGLRRIANDSEISCVYNDFGIAQINLTTAKNYNFNIQKLLKLEYGLEAGAIVLSWFHKTYAHRELYWWSRYNCGTSKSINRVTCNNYIKLVSRYL